MKKILSVFLVCLILLSLAACGAAAPAAPAETETVAETTAAAETTASVETQAPAAHEPAVAALEDGVYTATFSTDSGMFHVNEAYDNKGTLVVQDGAMTIHVVLAGKGILNLFCGTADEAKKDGAEVLEPSEEEVVYSDGFKDKAYAFDIPVPALDAEFPVALIGKKGTWYDHMVSVSDPVRMD